MITATFQKKNNLFVSYSVTGHANYAPLGKDIVCAGVSVLYTAATNTVIEQHDAAIDEYGTVQLGKLKDSQYITSVLYSNLLEIAKEHPEHIEIITLIEEAKANYGEIITGTLNAQDIKSGSLINSTDQIEHLRQKLI